MKTFLSILILYTQLLVTGCAHMAEMFQTPTDRAYRNGSITKEEYDRLKIQEEAERRQRQFVADQAALQRQHEIMSQYMQNTAASAPTYQMPYIAPEPSGFGGGGVGGGSSGANALPSGMQVQQMQNRQGVPTGRRVMKDTHWWVEYRLIDGTTYWRLQDL